MNSALSGSTWKDIFCCVMGRQLHFHQKFSRRCSFLFNTGVKWQKRTRSSKVFGLIPLSRKETLHKTSFCCARLLVKKRTNTGISSPSQALAIASWRPSRNTRDCGLLERRLPKNQSDPSLSYQSNIRSTQ